MKLKWGIFRSRKSPPQRQTPIKNQRSKRFLAHNAAIFGFEVSRFSLQGDKPQFWNF
jgi:hypothetical protein